MLAAPHCPPRKTLLNSEIISGFAERNWLMISGNQLRAVRALVGCDRATIAKAAGIGLPTLIHMEVRSGPVSGAARSLQAVLAALAERGGHMVPKGLFLPVSLLHPSESLIRPVAMLRNEALQPELARLGEQVRSDLALLKGLRKSSRASGARSR
jgi:hypothetical protein